MNENADLERGASEALLHYRNALAKVEALEKEEATAQQALDEWRGRIGKLTSHFVSSDARSNFIEAGQKAISRLHSVRLAMSEATAELRSAFTILVAFDDAFNYLPIKGATDSNVKDAGDSPEE